MRFPLPLLLLPLLLAAGCSRKPAAPPPVRGALLVTVEGAPFSVVECAPAALRPVVETLGPAQFEVVSPEVLPAAATALTGLLPPQHGLRVDGVGALDPAVPTLATRFRDKGYECAAFLSDIALSPVHGLTNGFSVYSVSIAPTNRATRFHRTSAEVCAEAAAWLDGRPRDRPVFVWIHLSPPGLRMPSPGRPDGFGDIPEIADVLARFAADAPVAVVPLLPDRGEIEGLARPGYPVDTPGGLVRNVFSGDREAGPPLLGPLHAIADVPRMFGFGETWEPHYWESLVPWYAFRLPPLESRAPDCPVSVLDGLAADPVPTPLAHQNAMAVLRANGHLGEGLIPPYTNSIVAADEIDEAGAARVERWRAAAAAPATNRVAALRALVESDPDVPLFHHELGEALLREKDFTGACNAFAAASRLGWNMVLANRLQARCHVAIGNVPAAIDRAEDAFLADETDPVPRRELAELLLRTGAALLASDRLADAKECLDRTLLLAPGHPAARLESARLELRAGDTNAAVDRLRLLLRDRPGDKAAQSLLRSIGK